MTPDPAKLRGLPPVRYINLDRSPDRRAFMEKQFADWGVADATRFAAFDAKDADMADHISGVAPDHGSVGYLGSMVSHFTLLDGFLSRTGFRFFARFCKFCVLFALFLFLRVG